MEASLEGQTALVTGASSGIGRAVARRLATAGVKVALAGRSQERLKLAQASLPGEGHLISPCDVRNDKEVAATVSVCEAAWGHIDILVNSAGLYKIGPLTELTTEVWDDMWQTNVSGSVFATRAALPKMLERGRGTIVFLSSVAAHRGFADNTAYSATKYAVTGFARSLTTEVRRKGVRVVNALIGPVDTPMWEDKSAPLEPDELLTPDEVAQALYGAMTVSDRQVIEDVLLLPQRGLYF